MQYTPSGGGINQLTGDGTAGPGTGSQALTLATVTTAETVGDATHYPIVTTDAKGRVTGMVATAVPAGVAPATTVTGPDAYGAAAVVGASTEYARADHDHGLPAAPAASLSYNANTLSTATNPGLTYATFLTTSSLNIGVWLINFNSLVNAATTASNAIYIQIIDGTATASYIGPTQTGLVIGTTALSNDYFSLSFSCIAVITVAGTLEFQSYVNSSGPQIQASPSTGYTAIQIA